MSNQQIGVGRRLQCVGSLQQRKRFFRIGGEHQLTRELQAVGILRIRLNHLRNNCSAS